MNSSKVHIIELPSNLGLKKKENDTEPGVKYLPEWLNKHGFHDRIGPEKILRIEPPAYSMDWDEESGVRNADEVIAYAMKQSRLLYEQLDSEAFQVIIGGDCSILIGSALALKQKGEYGLFFLDGHTDFIGPDLSQTGAVAGMDLAIVTGHGHEKLTNICKLKPYFKEKNVFCVGNRDFDPVYVQPILDSQIAYFDLHKLRANGLKKTANQFLKLVQENKLDGFFIHLDVDVLNDEIMPAVDSREKDGLTYLEFAGLLEPLLSSKKAMGIEITILDPNLDKKGIYTLEFVNRFIGILEKARANSDNQKQTPL